ncbi:RICIN domain-containing protein [Streptomyces sp. Act143]|uniref:RICIN domain-containing protein n=1 Tax=Streptomyces sp. Act143 TaxID=2200760 RepID=UPI0015E7F3CD|nr:RICIN domain-containing protein [Streptomyces sp. Act143]
MEHQFPGLRGGFTTAGTPNIVQQSANGAATALWLLVQLSDGSYAFENHNGPLCLDLHGGSSAPGRRPDQWPCKNTPGTDTNQDFTPR